MGALLPDAAAGRPADWRRFSATLLIAAAALFAGLFGAAVALDPYNTGRFGLVSTRGVPYQGPRTANASRGRDPAFDSAVIGNSHIQLLKPQRLDAALGASFVSLVVPGTGPREQLTMLDYFARRHRTPNVLILGVDGQWCTPSQAPPLAHPFPFWLYGEDDWEYVRGLLRLDTLWRLDPRIRQITTGRKSLAIADGYWDYERDYRLQGRDAPEVARRGLALRTLLVARNPAGRFPMADRLAEALGRLPAQTAVVLVRPPVYVTAQAEPGTPAAAEDAVCRAALAQVAAGRPRTVWLDRETDGAENRSPDNFFDHSHYRMPVAQALEAEIAAALAAVRGW